MLCLRPVRRAVPPEVPQTSSQVIDEGEGHDAFGRERQQRVRPGPGVDGGREVSRQGQPTRSRRADRQRDARRPVDDGAQRVDRHPVVEGLAVDLEDVRGDRPLGGELE